MRFPLRLVLLVSLLIPGLVLAACSGGEDDKPAFDDVIVLRNDDIQPVIVTHEFVVGANRFAMGLLDDFNTPIVDANVHLTFYDLNDGQQVAKFERDATVVLPARDAGIAEEIVHTHADGTRHVHINRGQDFGIYTSTVEFDRPGDWGVLVDIQGERVDLEQPLQLRFTVLPEGTIPNVGDPAPPSRNLTADDVEDLAIVDTSQEPSRETHELTIAEAIESGKPTVVLFAAPGYCTSQLCGPEYEILRKLNDRYKQQVNFIHVEFYENPASPDRKPVPAAVEWKLPTEPWFFVIDTEGIIRARFDGPTGMQEIEAALRDMGMTLAQP